VAADIIAMKADTAAILVDTGTTLDAAIAVIDTNVDQIETAVITNAAGTDIAADIIALKAETVLIVADTGELQTDWVNGGRLDLLLDAIPTTAMRGTDSAALASVCTEARLAELAAANLPTDIDAILVDTASLNDTKIPDTLSLANINAEVDTALATTTYAEPAQGAPGTTLSLADKIGFNYKAWRNRSNQTATTYQLFNDDATTVDHKATISDDATTAEKGEVATGP